MKYLLAFAAFITLSGCSILKPALEATRIDGNTVMVSTSLAPTLIIASSTTIDAWEPVEACEREGNYKDDLSGLVCQAPVAVRVYGTGSYSVQVVNGLLPVTRPVTLK
jgi:hypothetical protein